MKSFYERREWLELRFKVLNRYGWKCMSCNVTKDGGAIIQVDHIKPVSIYPELALNEDNLQVLCRDCNMGKSNKIQVDLRSRQKPVTLGPLGLKVMQMAAEQKDRRRAAAAARLGAYFKKKLKAAEILGDEAAHSLWMKNYFDYLRKLSLMEKGA